MLEADDVCRKGRKTNVDGSSTIALYIHQELWKLTGPTPIATTMSSVEAVDDEVD